MSEHMLASVGAVWREAAPKFHAELVDASSVAAQECEKNNESQSIAEALERLAQWMDHVITKFGACAAVADEKDVKGLEPIASEIIKVFLAVTGTFMTLRDGAGRCLCCELHQTGQDLASALEQLGRSIGKPTMALCAGKALDCAQRLAHTSYSNKLAIKKQLQETLRQLQDGHRELKEAMQPDSNPDDELCSEDGIFDDSLDPDELRVAELTSAAVSLLEKLLQKALEVCQVDVVQGSGPSMHELDSVAGDAAIASAAVDGMIAHLLGGLDQPDFEAHMQNLYRAITGFRGNGLHTERVEESLEQLRNVLLDRSA